MGGGERNKPNKPWSKYSSLYNLGVRKYQMNQNRDECGEFIEDIQNQKSKDMKKRQEQAGAELGQAQLPIGIGLYCD